VGGTWNRDEGGEALYYPSLKERAYCEDLPVHCKSGAVDFHPHKAEILK